MDPWLFATLRPRMTKENNAIWDGLPPGSALWEQGGKLREFLVEPGGPAGELAELLFPLSRKTQGGIAERRAQRDVAAMDPCGQLGWICHEMIEHPLHLRPLQVEPGLLHLFSRPMAPLIDMGQKAVA